VPLVTTTTTGRRHERAPEGEKARRPFVQEDVDPHALVADERARERARPRPRGDDRVGEAGAHPLVDERRRETRL
jgi:hypothetical protein